ncbi:hypothetical protein [Cohnella sp. AR92]|uniref:hypothetical protein n=1 Tax=Cohnella sp. AR92 TaxID=648716 RepID=UPI000F8DB46C|nr:hypothetical protein [Cohnella sp. AR92]RUS44976.1 hypothetical protein ELR57_22235 [Cohnella sp. AR92]
MSTQKFVSYWQAVFSSQDPIKALGLNGKDLTQFEIGAAPEPYYGYIHEDLSNDVLLLLLNPGARDERTREEGWNEIVKDRYVRLWSKEEYNQQEEVLKKQNRWRDKRFQQARGIVGDIGFLHTMEFFPFHSRKDELTERFKRAWVNDFPLADLTFHALKDIAVNRRAKAIFSVSNDWIRLLDKHNVSREMEVVLRKHSGKDYSFSFKLYRFNEGGLPILFCDLRGSPINLPKNQFAVHVSRILLGLTPESLPLEHPEFEIRVR